MHCRSREGAWIEIIFDKKVGAYGPGRSREGAWIEITYDNAHVPWSSVAPVRERGLK